MASVTIERTNGKAVSEEDRRAMDAVLEVTTGSNTYAHWREGLEPDAARTLARVARLALDPDRFGVRVDGIDYAWAEKCFWCGRTFERGATGWESFCGDRCAEAQRNLEASE